MEERLEEADLLEVIGEADGIICGDDRFTERVFASAPRLKVIAKWGSGIDSIDPEAARRHGVKVFNTPGAFTDPVADSVLGYMLAFARRIPWATASMRAGEWLKVPGRSLSETTVGVVGVGRIGAGVARRARAFGARILGHDIREPGRRVLEETGIVMVSLDELLREADFVSLHCDLNPTSRRLIGPAQFDLMKDTAVLINTARGPIVDETALVNALQTGRIAGSALDVFEDEPLAAASPLRGMENVLLAPHNSNSSPTAWEAVHRHTVRCLLEGLGLVAPESGRTTV